MPRGAAIFDLDRPNAHYVSFGPNRGRYCVCHCNLNCAIYIIFLTDGLELWEALFQDVEM